MKSMSTYNSICLLNNVDPDLKHFKGEIKHPNTPVMSGMIGDTSNQNHK